MMVRGLRSLMSHIQLPLARTIDLVVDFCPVLSCPEAHVLLEAV